MMACSIVSGLMSGAKMAEIVRANRGDLSNQYLIWVGFFAVNCLIAVFFVWIFFPKDYVPTIPGIPKKIGGGISGYSGTARSDHGVSGHSPHELAFTDEQVEAALEVSARLGEEATKIANEQLGQTVWSSPVPNPVLDDFDRQKGTFRDPEHFMSKMREANRIGDAERILRMLQASIEKDYQVNFEEIMHDARTENETVRDAVVAYFEKYRVED
jgi:hypothetical protein